MKNLIYAIPMILFAVLFSACDSTEPEGDGAGDQEFITRVVLTLNDGEGGTVTATASDPDGDGTDFQITSLDLEAGASYTGTVSVFDDINNEDVGAEIEEEDYEHQFFYTVGGAASDRVAIAITDTDENGLPVGLSFTVSVTGGTPVTGTLNVVLSHYDDTPKDGTNRSDETDVDVTFPVTVQ